MAQSGYTPILIYASGTATNIPAAGDLISGSSGAELAINYADGKLYYKDSGGSVQLIASKAGASGDVVGPASATDNAIARFDGTSGKIIQNSAVTVADTTGDITGGKYNGLTITTSTGTLTIANGKTLTANNTLTLSGTDSTTMTFPSTSATIARTDAAQTFTGVQTFSSNPILSGGTANGVLYLNGSKVATSGSALTFDGSFYLGLTGAMKINSNGYKLRFYDATGATGYGYLYTDGTNLQFDSGNTQPLSFLINGSEQMRLTSTGLGIGTSSPGSKLTVSGTGTTAITSVKNTDNFTGGTNFTEPHLSVNSGNTVTGNVTRLALTVGSGGQVYFDSLMEDGVTAYSSLLIRTRGAGGVLERARIDSSGNLGIGTSSPAYKLDVTGTINSGASSATGYNLVFRTSGITTGRAQTGLTNTSGDLYTGIEGSTAGASLPGSAAYSAFVGTFTANPLYFVTNGVIRTTLDSSGNLGLGVTPSGWASTYRAYQVGQAGSLFGLTNDQDRVGVSSNAYFDTTDSRWEYIGTGYAMRYDQNAGEHQWYTAPSGTAGNAITFTQAMTLNANGELLIGTTTSVTAACSIQAKTSGSSIWSINDATLNYSQFYFGGTATSGFQFIRSDGRSGGWLAFGTQDTERARITSGGDVVVTGVGGLGYGTGSGGAVTQATSRTTGVTLDKTNGAITLVSAAGTTTWQTFTVTNNKVAATDTVIVNQKSGTDLYQIFVTNVAAGSFKISFATTGGTTTEQPVFNFAVIKAVTA